MDTPHLITLGFRALARGPEPAAIVGGLDGPNAEEPFRTTERAEGMAGGVGVGHEIACRARAGREDIGEPGTGFGEGGVGVFREVQQVGVL